MPYSLIQLARGAYDLLLNNTVMGSLVRNGSRQPYSWTAELLGDPPQGERPAPFTEIERTSPAWSSYVSGSATPS